MTKRVLIVTTNFWPEPTGSGPYASDLAKSLKLNNYSVQVLTGMPHYPWWEVPETFQENLETLENLDGIHVVRGAHYVPKKLNIISRFRFEISLINGLRRSSKRLQVRDFELIISIGSSIAGGLVAKDLSRKWRVPYGIVLHDLAGEGVSQSGLSGGSLIAGVVSRIERKILDSATGIVAISQKMREVIIKMGIEESKVKTILLYAPNPINPIDRNVARDKLRWKSKDFVVIHTGNMGAKQDLENVVLAADKLKDNLHVKIYLVGHGNQENKLRTLCKGKRNVFLMPAVPDDQYSFLLSAADLLLVNERETQTEMSLPSKLTSYLYSNRPVLAAVPRGGATWNFLEGVAELIDAGDPEKLAKKILDLSEDQLRLDQLAVIGMKFAYENLSPQVGRTKYLDWVESLI